MLKVAKKDGPFKRTTEFFHLPQLVKERYFLVPKTGIFMHYKVKTEPYFGKLPWAKLCGLLLQLMAKTVYCGCDDHIFYALNTNTGKIKWQLATDDKIRTSPWVAENRVIFGGMYLYIIEF